MASIPAVLELERRHGARGLRVVSVTREDDRAEVESAAKEHGMDYPGFLDVDGAWSGAAQMRAIPAFVIVDKQGRLAYRHAGRLSKDSESFERMNAIVENALERTN